MNLQQKKALRFAICFELKKARFFFVVVAVPSTGKSKDYFEIISVKFSSAWSLRESNIVELCFARETRDSSISPDASWLMFTAMYVCSCFQKTRNKRKSDQSLPETAVSTRVFLSNFAKQRDSENILRFTMYYDSFEVWSQELLGQPLKTIWQLHNDRSSVDKRPELSPSPKFTEVPSSMSAYKKHVYPDAWVIGSRVPYGRRSWRDDRRGAENIALCFGIFQVVAPEVNLLDFAVTLADRAVVDFKGR